MRKSATLSEAEIIVRAARAFRTADPRVLIGIGDDAAVLQLTDLKKSRGGSANPHLVVTTDILIESVHFDLRLLSLDDTGYKALMVNLSDLAAMGATPTMAFATVGVPAAAAADDIDHLLGGVKAAVNKGGVKLVGGDTTRAPQWLLGFTVLGEISGAPLVRSGARAGDNIWHSGQLGLSQTGLHQLWADAIHGRKTAAAHRRPEARLELGRYLQRTGYASACLDLSDSLSQCLLQLADASEVGLHLDFSAYPFAADVLAFRRQLRGWRTGGARAFYLPARWRPEKTGAYFHCLAEYILASAEDYELVFTAPQAVTSRLVSQSPTPLTCLGQVVPAKSGMTYQGEDGASYELRAIGFEHL